MALKFKKKKNIWESNPNMAVPFYLMSSYLYYEEDRSVLSDADFDDLCKMMLDKWDDIEHYHKHLIEKDQLKAGTGYYLKYKYPTIVVDAAKSWSKAV